MKIVEGRFAEARGYCLYALALLHPGREVPVFEAPRQPKLDVDGYTDEEYLLMVEEGRRQLDRQGNTMQHNNTRAATLLTITVAELVFFATAGLTVFARNPLVVAGWATGVLLATLALAGCASVLIAPAVYGYVDTVELATGGRPVLRRLASLYASAVGKGESTNAARLTVLRDAVWLSVLAGVFLVIVALFNRVTEEPPRCETNDTLTCNPGAAQPSAQPKTLGASPTATPTSAPSASTTQAATSSP